MVSYVIGKGEKFFVFDEKGWNKNIKIKALVFFFYIYILFRIGYSFIFNCLCYARWMNSKLTLYNFLWCVRWLSFIVKRQKEIKIVKKKKLYIIRRIVVHIGMSLILGNGEKNYGIVKEMEALID